MLKDQKCTVLFLVFSFYFCFKIRYNVLHVNYIVDNFLCASSKR
jgi:hypothetical protein